MAPRQTTVLALVLIALAAPLLVPPAGAADVSFRLVAFNFDWHRNNPGTPAEPTFVANAGDRLLFEIENQDAAAHTFTFPHFGVDVPLPAGATIFVNVTTATADVGTWQFWCSPHSTGTDPENHAGMIGWVELQGLADTTPPTIVHTEPAGPFEVGDPIPLAANVTDDIAVTAVRVNYTNVAGQFSNVSMVQQAGEYAFTIPAQTEAGNVSYILYAEDAAGNVALSGPFEVTVNAATPQTPAADYTLWIIVAVVVIAGLAAGILLWRRRNTPKAPGT
jgi:hypothetical protein